MIPISRTASEPLLSMFGIAYLLKAGNLKGIAAGIKVSLFIVAVFLLPILIGPWIFVDKFLLFAINMGFNLIGFTVSGIIIGEWQK